MPAPAQDATLDTRVELALHGVRSDDRDTPVTRSKGAGPSDDGHVVIDGRNATLPRNPASPYAVSGGRVVRDGLDLGLSVEPVRRPRFYDLETADGVPYRKIALLHGRDVLATTVVQTCIRYAEPDRCRFWQMVMTTGTTHGPDRGARPLVRCVHAVLEAVPGLPIQVQIEPPRDLSVLRDLRAAGATSIGIHVESLDDDVRRRWMPSKATITMAEYEAAWDEAVRVFGRNRVSTYLLIGMGEDPDALVAGAGRLIDRGVYPFVVPMRPMVGTLAHRDGARPAPASVVRSVTERVAALLRAAGMTGADQEAGCAACGACSLLSAAGG